MLPILREPTWGGGILEDPLSQSFLEASACLELTVSEERGEQRAGKPQTGKGGAHLELLVHQVHRKTLCRALCAQGALKSHNFRIWLSTSAITSVAPSGFPTLQEELRTVASLGGR